MSNKKRKYERYKLVADMGQVNEEYGSYVLGFADYCKQRKHGNPATLYGITFEGEMSVIFSHG